MKKSLCILLALFLLLTACKAVPDKDANGKGESISFQTASPWSRLKSLSAELMADNDFASSSPIFAMNSLEGTLGTTSYYVNTLEESMGNSQESTVSCTVRATEELQMIEYTQQMMGAEIPIIAWQVGEEGYAGFVCQAFPYSKDGVPVLVGADQKSGGNGVKSVGGGKGKAAPQAHIVAGDTALAKTDILRCFLEKVPKAVVMLQNQFAMDGGSIIRQRVPAGTIFGVGMNIRIEPM